MGHPHRLSLTDLTQRILEMSETGIYRESIFQVFKSLATKKDVRRAIAYAKTLGLYSVASLRDETLGTYYELDLTVYRQRKHAVDDIASWEAAKRKAALKQQAAAQVDAAASTVDTVQEMLAVVKGVAGLMLMLSLAFGLAGFQYISGIGLCLALGAAATWQLQRLLVQRRPKASLPTAVIEQQARSSGR
ncbi:MAG: hypothetical protein ACFB5Z_04380 [Elainellaceae cyanobacterium]